MRMNEDLTKFKLGDNPYDIKLIRNNYYKGIYEDGVKTRNNGPFLIRIMNKDTRLDELTKFFKNERLVKNIKAVKAPLYIQTTFYNGPGYLALMMEAISDYYNGRNGTGIPGEIVRISSNDREDLYKECDGKVIDKDYRILENIAKEAFRDITSGKLSKNLIREYYNITECLNDPLSMNSRDIKDLDRACYRIDGIISNYLNDLTLEYQHKYYMK